MSHQWVMAQMSADYNAARGWCPAVRTAMRTTAGPEVLRR
jgi:hypothetical protein